MIFGLDGKALDEYILVGVVLGASSEANRFSAMKKLLDFGVAKLGDSDFTPTDSEFTAYASKGAVCVLPKYQTSMYEGYNLDILYQKNGTTEALPASATKVMTALTGLPYISTIKEKVTLVSGDIESGSGNYFSAGDVLTIEDILYGMMLPSSNTCAKAFAHYVGGKILGNASASVSDCVSAFVSEMNNRASIIGCTDTEFDSPSGLSQNTTTTASDLLRIVVEACSFDEIMRIWGKKSYTISIGGTNPRTQSITTTVANTSLEASYYIFGGKTGHLNSPSDANSLVMIASPVS